MRRYLIATLLVLAVLAPTQAVDPVEWLMRQTGARSPEELVVDLAIDTTFSGLIEKCEIKNPKVNAAFDCALIGRGAPVGIVPAVSDLRREEQVERAMAEMLGLDPRLALQKLKSDEDRDLSVSGPLTASLMQMGALVVATPREVERTSRERAADRNNAEVRPGSVAPPATIERAIYYLVWVFEPLAGFEYNEWYQLLTQRNVITLTSELRVAIKLADTDVTVAYITIPIEIREVGANRDRGRSRQYASPFLHAMLRKASDYLGQMLHRENTLLEQLVVGKYRYDPAAASTIAAGEEAVEPVWPVVSGQVRPKLVPAQGLPRHRVIAQLTGGLTLISAGRADGLREGSAVQVGGYGFSVFRVADSYAFIVATSDSVGAREALHYDVPVQFIPVVEPVPAQTPASTD